MPPLTGLCGLIMDQQLTAAALFATVGMVEALLYGLHVILFFFCLVVICKKRRFTQWPILLPAIAMILISTADIALTFRTLSWVLPRLNNSAYSQMGMRLIQGKDTLFVASNCVAELTLLYRCYTVWDRSKYVLVCILFVIADTVWGFLGMGPTLLATDSNSQKFVPVYIWSLFAINILLTLITVTRIFWISRFTKQLLGPTQRASAYRTAIAILLETSVVYSVCLLVYLMYPTSPIKIYLMAIAMRLVGIMPTLLIVQVGLGGIKHNIKAPTTLSIFQVGTRPSSVVLDTLAATMLRDDGSRRIMPPSVHDEDTEAAPSVLKTSDERPKLSEPLMVEVKTGSDLS